MKDVELDFERLFYNIPGNHLILHADAPKYTILAVTDCYATITFTKKDDIIGKGLFEVFRDDPNNTSNRG